MIVRSITAEENRESASKSIMRQTSSSARTVFANHSIDRRIISVYLISLATLAIILATSIQYNDAASVGKYKSSRDRGCYYMLQHFKNGEQIKTDEPCLNCTCENSMLMCYLRVCPYVKPVGDRCIIERVPGECCPKITCSDVGPNFENLEQELEPATTAPITTTTTLPTTTTAATSTSAANGYDITFTNASEVQSGAGGCMLNNNYYHEGAQMPSDPSKPCEVCYCIRNSSACVMQDCALDVGGCTPIYQAGGCCPTRYNCSASNAFTTPRPQLGFKAPESTGRRRFWESDSVSKLLSLPSPRDQMTSISSTTVKPIAFPDFGRTTKLPPPGCKAPNSSRIYMDGERIPSKNKCEHCYCMRNEIVCAVQECRPPCDGCVPIIDADDQCCPKRYECAAPTQRVPIDNLIDVQETTASSNVTVPTNGDTTSTVASLPTSSPTSEFIEGTNIVETKSDSTIPTATPILASDSSFNPPNQVAFEEKPKSDVSVMTTRQTKPPLRPISPKLSLNEDDNSNEMNSEPDLNKSAKTEVHESPTSTSNVDGFNLHGEREQENDLVKAAGRFIVPEGSQQTGSNQAPDSSEPISPALTSTIAPVRTPENSQISAMATENQLPKLELTDETPNVSDPEKKVKPSVLPSSIPGEGSCRYNGKMYQNGQEVKSKDSCMEICMCINSVVYCDEVDCPKGPENQDRCQRVMAEGECCPRFICDEPATSSTTTTAKPATISSDTVSPSDQTPGVSEESSQSAQTTTPAPTVITANDLSGYPNISSLEATSTEKLPNDTIILDASRMDTVQKIGSTDSPTTTTSTLAPGSFSPSTLYDLLTSPEPTTTTAPALAEVTPSQTSTPIEITSSNGAASRSDSPAPTTEVSPNEVKSTDLASTPAQDLEKNLNAELSTSTTTEAPTELPPSASDQSTPAAAVSTESVDGQLEPKSETVSDLAAVNPSTANAPATTTSVIDAAPRESSVNDISSAPSQATSFSEPTTMQGQDLRLDLSSTVATPATADQAVSTEASPSSNEAQPSTSSPGVNEIISVPTTTTAPLLDVISTSAAPVSSSSVPESQTDSSSTRVELSSPDVTSPISDTENLNSSTAVSETSAPVSNADANVANENERVSESAAPTTVADVISSSQDQSTVAPGSYSSTEQAAPMSESTLSPVASSEPSSAVVTNSPSPAENIVANEVIDSAVAVTQEPTAVSSSPSPTFDSSTASSLEASEPPVALTSTGASITVSPSSQPTTVAPIVVETSSDPNLVSTETTQNQNSTPIEITSSDGAASRADSPAPTTEAAPNEVSSTDRASTPVQDLEKNLNAELSTSTTTEAPTELPPSASDQSTPAAAISTESVDGQLEPKSETVSDLAAVNPSTANAPATTTSVIDAAPRESSVNDISSAPSQATSFSEPTTMQGQDLRLDLSSTVATPATADQAVSTEASPSSNEAQPSTSSPGVNEIISVPTTTTAPLLDVISTSAAPVSSSSVSESQTDPSGASSSSDTSTLFNAETSTPATAASETSTPISSTGSGNATMDGKSQAETSMEIERVSESAAPTTVASNIISSQDQNSFAQDSYSSTMQPITISEVTSLPATISESSSTIMANPSSPFENAAPNEVINLSNTVAPPVSLLESLPQETTSNNSISSGPISEATDLSTTATSISVSPTVLQDLLTTQEPTTTTTQASAMPVAISNQSSTPVEITSSDDTASRSDSPAPTTEVASTEVSSIASNPTSEVSAPLQNRDENSSSGLSTPTTAEATTERPAAAIITVREFGSTDAPTTTTSTLAPESFSPSTLYDLLTSPEPTTTTTTTTTTAPALVEVASSQTSSPMITMSSDSTASRSDSPAPTTEAAPNEVSSTDNASTPVQDLEKNLNADLSTSTTTEAPTELPPSASDQSTPAAAVSTESVAEQLDSKSETVSDLAAVTPTSHPQTTIINDALPRESSLNEIVPGTTLAPQTPAPHLDINSTVAAPVAVDQAASTGDLTTPIANAPVKTDTSPDMNEIDLASAREIELPAAITLAPTSSIEPNGSSQASSSPSQTLSSQDQGSEVAMSSPDTTPPTYHVDTSTLLSTASETPSHLSDTEPSSTTAINRLEAETSTMNENERVSESAAPTTVADVISSSQDQSTVAPGSYSSTEQAAPMSESTLSPVASSEPSSAVVTNSPSPAENIVANEVIDSAVAVTQEPTAVSSSPSPTFDSSTASSLEASEPPVALTSTGVPITVSPSSQPTTLAPIVAETSSDSNLVSTETTQNQNSTPIEITSSDGAASRSDSPAPTTEAAPNEVSSTDKASTPVQDLEKNLNAELSTSTTTEAPTELPPSASDQSTPAAAVSTESVDGQLEPKSETVSDLAAVNPSTTDAPATTTSVIDAAPRESSVNDISSAPSQATSFSEPTTMQGQDLRLDLSSTVATPATADQAVSTEASPSSNEAQPSTSSPGVDNMISVPTTTTAPLLDVVSTSAAPVSSSSNPESQTDSSSTRVELSSPDVTSPISDTENLNSSTAVSETSAPVSNADAKVVNENERVSESAAPTTVANVISTSQDQGSAAGGSPSSSLSNLPMESWTNNQTLTTLPTTSPHESGRGSSEALPSTGEKVIYNEGSPTEAALTSTVSPMSSESSPGIDSTSSRPIPPTVESSPEVDQNVSSSIVESISPTTSTVPTIAFSDAATSMNSNPVSVAQVLPEFTEVKTTKTPSFSEIESHPAFDKIPASNNEQAQSIPVKQDSSIEQQGVNIVVSTDAPPISSNVTASPADEFLASVATSKSDSFKPIDVTTVIPSIRGSSTSITIPWSDISDSSRSSVEQAATNQSNPSTTNGTPFGTKSLVHEPTQSSIAESDYEEVAEDSGCEYEGKTYNSAQQIPRSHPCDFCFCFRGDIICLQQTCPPPVPHCFETVMDGFCCPRYECPVHTVRASPNSTNLALTPYDSHSKLHTHTHETGRPQLARGSSVRGCFVDNKLYGVEQVIESASGPCMECKCDKSGMMKCNPKECTPEDPLLQQINREVLQSTLSRTQVR